MDENSRELLNSIYKDISEKLGMDTALKVYQLYKGTQISFPMRFFNPNVIKKRIVEEFDGTNTKQLALKYDYSEKTIRRLIKKSISKEKKGE